MLESKLSIKDVVWGQILPTAASMSANQSQVFCQALDYYLSADPKYTKDLYNLAHSNTKEADEKITKYFMEGARLSTTASVLRDYKPASGVATTANIKDGSTAVSISAGQRVLIDFSVASRDPIAFPDPNEVKLDRPLDAYLHYGFGPHQCAGMDASITAITTLFKIVFGLKGLKRAQGSAPGGRWYGESQGEIKKVKSPTGSTIYMTPDQSSFFPFPTTMKIQWDSD